MKTSHAFKNILIVRTDRIGDVVLTTPAIKALRQACPTARITALVTPSTVELVDGNPYLDEVIVDDRGGRHHGFWGSLRLVRELRLKQFDLAVVYHTKRRYNWACFAAGIPYRLGFNNDKFGFLLTIPVKDTRTSGLKHEAQYCLDLLRAIGIQSGELDAFVPMQKEAEAWVLEFLDENQLSPNEFIAIHPGSSDPVKCWPTKDFAQLMDRLQEQCGLRIVLIGSPATAPIALDILKLTRRVSAVIDLTGKTSLAQTSSLLRRARLLISNDSGPVHVAAGVGTNVISLFMRDLPGIDVQRWKPLGPKSYILHNKLKPGEITIEEVLGLARQILKKNSQYEIF